MRKSIKAVQRTRRVAGFLLTLLLALSLAACGESTADDATTTPAQVSAQASSQSSDLQNASLALEPASGYGGLYVQVNGVNWPQNMMVLVTIEDAQGRSETLAASDTDSAGNLTTGFLFPIDQRWLESESLSVVTTTADGRIEAKAKFTLVPPGTEVASSSTSTTTSKTTEAVASSEQSDDEAKVTENKAVTESVAESDEQSGAEIDEEAGHTLILPLIASTGAERASTSRSARTPSSRSSGSSNSSDSSAVTEVDIEIGPNGSKSIDCRNGEQWLTVAIYSSSGFDATSVDPGSVMVAGGSSDLGYGGDSPTTTFVNFNAKAKPEPVARSRQAYQWRWHLDDVDGDGSIDMVLEFQLAYTELTCDDAVVAVTGRTNDGKRFEGVKRADMLVLDRS